MRPPAEREDDLLAGVDVVAVDEHLQRRSAASGAWRRHGGGCYRGSAVARPGRARASSRSSRRSSRAPSLQRGPHPLDEEHREEHQADQVAGAPQEAAGEVLVGERVGQPGPIAPRAAGYQSPPISLVCAHDRDAEERVERQRQQHQQQPERVAHPTRHRVDARAAARRTGSRPRRGARAWARGRTASRSEASYQPEKYSAHGLTRRRA